MTSVKDRIAKFNQPVSTSTENPPLDKSGSLSAGSKQRVLSVRSTSSQTEPSATYVSSSTSIQISSVSNNKIALLSKSFEGASIGNDAASLSSKMPVQPTGVVSNSRVAHLSKSFEVSKGTTTGTSGTATTTSAFNQPSSTKVNHLSKSFQKDTVAAVTNNDITTTTKTASVQSSSPANSKTTCLSKSFESAKVSGGISKPAEQSSSLNSKVNLIISKSLDDGVKVTSATSTSARISPVNSEVSRLTRSIQSAKMVLSFDEKTLTSDQRSLVEETIGAIEKALLAEFSGLTGQQTESPSSGLAHVSKAFETGSKVPSPAIVGASSAYTVSPSKSSMPSERPHAKNQNPIEVKSSSNAVSKQLPENLTGLVAKKRALSLNQPSLADEPKSVTSKVLSKETQGKRTFPEISVGKQQPVPAPSVKKVDPPSASTREARGRAISFCKQKRVILAGSRADALRRLVDISAIDAVAMAKTPSDARTSTYDLVQYLTGLVYSLPCMEGASELARQFAMLRVFQRWIGHNIAYDAKTLHEGTITSKKCEPAYILKVGMAVCSGYSRLLCEMAELAGLTMRCVSGASKGGGYMVGDTLSSKEPDHEWNVVTLGGEVYHLDATWSAGTCQGLKFTREWNEHYFLTPAELFVLDHFPEDPGDQFISPAFTLEDFVSLPNFQPNFFLAGMVPSTPWTFNGVIDCDGQPEIELKFNISESWKVHQPDFGPKRRGGMSKKIPDLVNVFWESKTQLKVLCRIPEEKGEYILRFYTRPREGNEGESYSWAADYLVRVNHAPIETLGLFPFIYSTDQLKVLEPLKTKLAVETAVRFRHQLVGSGKQQDHRIVVVLPGNDWVYLKSSKREADGSILFEDVVYMEKPGEVKLSIQYAGEKSCHTVAKYKVT